MTRRVRHGRGAGAALVVFDADDTLWHTEALYDAARSACRRIVERAGLPGVLWERLEREIDVANVERLGLSRERFPTSCVEAYRRVAGPAFSEEVAAATWAAADHVFAETAQPADGVPEAVLELSRTCRIVLLTQGDIAVQRKRVADSGLATAFDDAIFVERKTAASFADVVDADGRAASECWSVGNSLPSDINPAIEAGLHAVWVDAHVWEHERRDTQALAGVVRVASLREVPSVIVAGSGRAVRP